MIKTIENPYLKLSVSTLGAEMMELTDGEGIQYLWQGDPNYWRKRAPNLFPFIGRLTDQSYTHRGQVYPMGIHGFASSQEFAVDTQENTALTLRLDSNEETLRQYPFAFSLLVTYRLDGTSVHITYEVRNHSGETMPFGIGGHPGFRVPLSEDECFTDYALEFSQACQPDRIGFTPAVYLSGHDEVYPLEADKRLPLRHDLFDDDAIILKNVSREIKLYSKTHSITVTYPQMPYLGIWHCPKKDAPYVCIEPWTSLPARQDVVEELLCKSDLIHLEAGDIYRNTWTIRIGDN